MAKITNKTKLHKGRKKTTKPRLNREESNKKWGIIKTYFDSNPDMPATKMKEELLKLYDIKISIAALINGLNKRGKYFPTQRKIQAESINLETLADELPQITRENPIDRGDSIERFFYFKNKKNNRKTWKIRVLISEFIKSGVNPSEFVSRNKDELDNMSNSHFLQILKKNSDLINEFNKKAQNSYMILSNSLRSKSVYNQALITSNIEELQVKATSYLGATMINLLQKVNNIIIEKGVTNFECDEIIKTITKHQKLLKGIMDINLERDKELSKINFNIRNNITTQNDNVSKPPIINLSKIAEDNLNKALPSDIIDIIDNTLDIVVEDDDSNV